MFIKLNSNNLSDSKGGVSLFTLFTEPGVGKVQARKLKEDSRSHRKCRHVYSLMAGAAARTQPCCILWNGSTHSHNAATRAFQVGLQNISDPWPVECILRHMCSAISDLSCYHVKSLFTGHRAWARGCPARELNHRHLG